MTNAGLTVISASPAVSVLSGCVRRKRTRGTSTELLAAFRAELGAGLRLSSAALADGFGLQAGSALRAELSALGLRLALGATGDHLFAQVEVFGEVDFLELAADLLQALLGLKGALAQRPACSFQQTSRQTQSPQRWHWWKNGRISSTAFFRAASRPGPRAISAICCAEFAPRPRVFEKKPPAARNSPPPIPAADFW
jgi:hypothetical protein